MSTPTARQQTIRINRLSKGERHAFQGTGARERTAQMVSHHVLARDGAKELMLLLHRRQGQGVSLTLTVLLIFLKAKNLVFLFL